MWQAKAQKQPLTNVALQDKRTKNVALFFLRLKDLVPAASLEEMLDAMIGIGQINEKLKLPMKKQNEKGLIQNLSQPLNSLTPKKISL